MVDAFASAGAVRSPQVCSGLIVREHSYCTGFSSVS
jgi:hypothetical protein